MLYLIVINNQWIDTSDDLEVAKRLAYRYRQKRGYVATLAQVYRRRFFDTLIWTDNSPIIRSTR